MSNKVDSKEFAERLSGLVTRFVQLTTEGEQVRGELVRIMGERWVDTLTQKVTSEWVRCARCKTEIEDTDTEIGGVCSDCYRAVRHDEIQDMMGTR
jgi:protein-arginine kinase activator protein McsA